MGASRPVYQLFLERCILIEAVQRHRDDADEAEVAVFFATGCYSFFTPARALRVAPEIPAWLVVNTWCSLPRSYWPESIRAGWEAMEHASEALVAGIMSGKVRLEGTSPSGLRHVILPAELAWPHMAIDFQHGKVVECWSDGRVVLWKDVTEVAEKLPARTAGLIAKNAERDARQRPKWAQWQAAADHIGKAHPTWTVNAVALKVAKQLKTKERGDTIRKRIKKTW